MDIVSARSDWSGDESLMALKCGPFIGHEAVERFTHDPGGGHVHPDANHFVLFGAGEWLIRDDGYRAKWTGQHNTLLIDGKGQLGEGAQWFQGSQALKLKARPRILKATSTVALDHIVGDATEAYPPETGLKRYVRHALFVKPDVLLILDDIEADHEAALELRFHPEARAVTQEGSVFTAQGEGAALRVEALTTMGVEASAGDIAGEGRHGEQNFSMYTMRLQKSGTGWRNAVALSWSKSGAQPAPVTLSQAGDVWTFATEGRRIIFDWTTGEAHVE